MTEAPKKIWAWPHFDGWVTGDWSANTYHDGRTVPYILATEHERLMAEKDARIARLRGALEWYGEQAMLCRLIHREGDAGRHALNDDCGKRARAALGDDNG